MLSTHNLLETLVARSLVGILRAVIHAVVVSCIKIMRLVDEDLLVLGSTGTIVNRLNLLLGKREGSLDILKALHAELAGNGVLLLLLTSFDDL